MLLDDRQRGHGVRDAMRVSHVVEHSDLYARNDTGRRKKAATTE
jgi:hypothetical protein